MNDLREKKILNDKLDTANKYSQNVRNSQIQYIAQGMKGAEEFYYKLAIISASAITFSITFITYISTTGKVLSNIQFLIASWVFLLFSLFGSIYRNHFHSNFLHYQLQKKWLISKIDVEILVKKMLKKYPETAYNAFEGIDRLINASNSRKTRYVEAKKRNEIKELFYDLLWTYCLKVAHIGFILGLLFMVLFAIVNLK